MQRVPCLHGHMLTWTMWLQWQDQLLQLLPEDMRSRGIASSAANTSPSKMPSPGAEQATSRQSAAAAAAAASSVQQPATGLWRVYFVMLSLATLR